MRSTFTCGHCGRTFDDLGPSDEEAMAEARSVFTEQELSGELAVVCDDCWVAVVEAKERERP